MYSWTRSRPTRTFGESNDQVRDKSESKYQRVQDKSETIEKRLESGLSPTLRCAIRKIPGHVGSHGVKQNLSQSIVR